MARGRKLRTLEITTEEDFDLLVRKLSQYFVDYIETPHSWDDLRKTVYGTSLKPLLRYLVDEVHHRGIVSALLALKWHFSNIDDEDDRTLNDTRGLACELVAWRFVTHLSETEVIDFLCYDLPGSKGTVSNVSFNNNGSVTSERSPLISDEIDSRHGTFDSVEDATDRNVANEANEGSDDCASFATFFAGLNALEIGAVSNAKKFLSQRAIQRVIDGLWHGDIVFWETINTRSTKQARLYNQKKSDPFCRLRVPKYLKCFEVVFFAAFLAFYYAVLIQKPTLIATFPEIMLYVWLASFTYNEFVEFRDAGGLLYSTDTWAIWDLGIIANGTAFFVLRMIGLAKEDTRITDIAFDVLSVEALFLVPRICSLLSLHPYFGTLIPCLKEMTKDFCKFLGLVAILYLGFDTTFAFLARGTYSFSQMNWILIKVFFGSSFLGFDVAEEISPILGPPLMFIFVVLTNILLLTSLISLLSASVDRVLDNVHETAITEYSVYVLEASTSNRLTFFLPPLNLIPLLLRPLRLFLSASELRNARIVILKATHWPFVFLLLGYERWRVFWRTRGRSRSSSLARPIRGQAPYSPNSLRRPLSVMSNGGRTVGSSHAATVPSSPLVQRNHNAFQMEQSAASSQTMDLKAVVSNLRSQIEALSTMLEEQTEAQDSVPLRPHTHERDESYT